MDRRAALAMTNPAVHGPSAVSDGFGRLAMTTPRFMVRVRYRAGFGGLAMTAWVSYIVETSIGSPISLRGIDAVSHTILCFSKPGRTTVGDMPRM
jgi:hypothetical protein